MSDVDRPDPATDLVGSLRWIMQRIEELGREREEECINASEFARRTGHHPGYFSPGTYPWRVPHFGARGSLFPFSEWREWYDRGEKALRSEWDAIPLQERRRMFGIKEAS